MERALLLTVKLEYDKATWDVLELQRELRHLAESAGAVVIAEELCQRDRPTPNFYIGEGKVYEMAQLVLEERIDIVIFNNDLSGTQKRNLEKIISTRVIDRTQLILDIFSRRAKSPEGKAQVELAQLGYLLPRLAGRGQQFSRLGGGIGTRGPGEQKLEEDRRRIRDRILRLKRDLNDLEFRRQKLRSRRDEVSLPTVVFIGYTSAGKTTLFNALAGTKQPISKGLFTTLDPLSRSISLPNNQKIIISDTVGFIRQLPHHLIEAFKATLEEVVQASLLVHVLDISSPKTGGLYSAVRKVLEELGAAEKETILVLNKIDKVENAQDRQRFARDYPGSVAISALKKENLDAVLNKIEERLSTHLAPVSLAIPLDKMELVDFVYRSGDVKEIDYSVNGVRLKAVLPVLIAKKLQNYVDSE